jgi:hypothetical protein
MIPKFQNVREQPELTPHETPHVGAHDEAHDKVHDTVAFIEYQQSKQDCP